MFCSKMSNCKQRTLDIRLNNIEASLQTSHVLVDTQLGPFHRNIR